MLSPAESEDMAEQGLGADWQRNEDYDAPLFDAYEVSP